MRGSTGEVETAMRAGRWAVLAAVIVSMVAAAAPAGAAIDAPSACKIERPAGLWPPYFYDDYWNTYTHGGFNSDATTVNAYIRYEGANCGGDGSAWVIVKEYSRTSQRPEPAR